jgi:DnaJ-class molecular chaperone
MKIEKALNLLGLRKESTMQELNYSYRQLAKRYHPDFNSGREEWANSMMTQVNLAYEVALDYLAQFKEHSTTGGQDDVEPLVWTRERTYEKRRCEETAIQGFTESYTKRDREARRIE